MRVKKAAAILLAASVLAGLVSCGSGGDNSESVSSGYSEQVSEESSDAELQPTPQPIDAIITGDAVRDGERRCLSLGKTYKTDLLSSPTYEDTGETELTDGSYGQAGFTEEWSGYELKGSFGLEIVVDLGKVAEDIADFEVSFLAWSDCGIKIPPEVEFQVSRDGENYISVGRVYNAVTPSGTPQRVGCALRLGKTVGARYIKVIIDRSDVWWLFMDEIAVYAYDKDGGDKEPTYEELGKKLYTAEPIEKITEEVFWDSSEPGYGDMVNLVSGLTQRVYVPVALSGFFEQYYKNSEAACPFLTDGNKIGSVWTDGWYKSVHGIERNIVFDLQKTSAVASAALGIGNCGGAGIYMPRYIRVWLSDDGVNWQKVYDDSDPQASNGPERINYNADFGKTYKARFINIQIGVSCFVYIDEIEVFGTKRVGDDAVALKPAGSYDTVFPGDYLKPREDLYKGASNILLAPYIQTAQSPQAGITEETWLPYLAYVDGDGNIADTMFDGCLLAPYWNTFEKGFNPKTVNNYINYLFAENLNLNSLETAAGKIKETLNLDSYKIPVIITLPGTFNRDYAAGDYDGDGVDERFETFDDLKKMTDWFMARCEALFGSQNYKNLVFGGYYWPTETVEYQKPFEEQLIKYTSEKCHEKGYSLSFIPFLRASGYQEWGELGFDAVNMQPNYPWYDYPKEIVAETADESKLLGISVEMEIHPSALDSAEFYGKYIEYLNQGALKGYMGSLLFYYQGGMPGEYFRAFKGEGRYGRKIYDLTYQFIKGTYEATAAEAFDAAYDLSKNKAFTGAFSDGGADGGITYDIGVSPVYGSVRNNHDGTFTYFPAEGFTGTDVFTFTASAGGENTVGTITLNVK